MNVQTPMRSDADISAANLVAAMHRNNEEGKFNTNGHDRRGTQEDYYVVSGENTERSKNNTKQQSGKRTGYSSLDFNMKKSSMIISEHIMQDVNGALRKNKKKQNSLQSNKSSNKYRMAIEDEDVIQMLSSRVIQKVVRIVDDEYGEDEDETSSRDASSFDLHEQRKNQNRTRSKD